MSSAELIIRSDPQEVAREFAGFLENMIRVNDRLNIALSGGSSPALLFDILSDDYLDLAWEKVHFFWGDERCVPPADKESNFRMTREHLLNNISLSWDNIHRIMGENDPSEEADRYSHELGNLLPQSNGLPVFDIIMLGMGADGHTASIFPHESELLTSANWCEVATHPESGQKRVTLTGPVINAAKNICFLVTGSSKNEKILEIFGQMNDWQSYPASHINPVKGKLTWYIDDAAGAGLKL